MNEEVFYLCAMHHDDANGVCQLCACSYVMLSPVEANTYHNIIQPFTNSTQRFISYLNDVEHLSFERFADEAKKLGL